MSSATATDDPLPTGSYTYWCHECDMSVSLRPSPSLLCPHCFGNFLELMDSSSSSSPRSSTDSPFPPLSDSLLHHLVRHLAADDYFPSNPNPAAVDDALVTVEIAASLLETDPLVFCPVCKDQFVVGVEAKQLPCKHLYHPDCILPWLANHTTCPVCRFQLPTKPLNPRRSSAATTPFRFGDLLAGDEDRFGYGSTLRYIARRHRDLLSLVNGDENSSPSLSPSPTQMAEAEIGLVARTSSVETVSSWPVEAGGAGSRELGVSGRAIEDAADAPIAGVKVSSSSVS